MPLPCRHARRRPPVALPLLLLLALALALAAASAATARPSSAARPHGKAVTARVLVAGFTHRRAHGARGLGLRPRRHGGTTRPGTTQPAAPVSSASSPAPAPTPAGALGTLVQTVVPDVILPLPATTPDPVAPDPAPAPVAPSVLGIQTFDTPSYRMLLSRPTVTAGTVRLQLRNGGEDEHNVLLTRSDGTGDAIPIALTAPGTTRTLSVRLEPGRYRLLCTLQTPVVHDSAGMHATLDVSAAP